MFFKETRFNGVMDRLCHKEFMDRQHDIQIVDLVRPRMFGPTNHRKYVVHMGLYRDDMFMLNVPLLTWYCQRNGHIWCEWKISAPKNTAIYNAGQNWGKLSESTHGTFNICIPMSLRSIRSVLAYSKEHIVMHKLTSDRML
jgi:hypothetical protein